jgi:hypothetical protein
VDPTLDPNARGAGGRDRAESSTQPRKPKRGVTSREQSVLPVTDPGEFQDRCRIKLLEDNGSSGKLPAATMGAAIPIRSPVRDHDLAEMTATLEMAVGLLGLGEWECPIDHRMQLVHGDRPVHGLEIGAAPDAD